MLETLLLLFLMACLVRCNQPYNANMFVLVYLLLLFCLYDGIVTRDHCYENRTGPDRPVCIVRSGPVTQSRSKALANCPMVKPRGKRSNPSNAVALAIRPEFRCPKKKKSMEKKPKWVKARSRPVVTFALTSDLWFWLATGSGGEAFCLV